MTGDLGIVNETIDKTVDMHSNACQQINNIYSYIRPDSDLSKNQCRGRIFMASTGARAYMGVCWCGVQEATPQVRGFGALRPPEASGF